MARIMEPIGTLVEVRTHCTVTSSPGILLLAISTWRSREWMPERVTVVPVDSGPDDAEFPRGAITAIVIGPRERVAELDRLEASFAKITSRGPALARAFSLGIRARGTGAAALCELLRVAKAHSANIADFEFVHEGSWTESATEGIERDFEMRCTQDFAALRNASAAWYEAANLRFRYPGLEVECELRTSSGKPGVMALRDNPPCVVEVVPTQELLPPDDIAGLALS